MIDYRRRIERKLTFTSAVILKRRMKIDIDEKKGQI